MPAAPTAPHRLPSAHLLERTLQHLNQQVKHMLLLLLLTKTLLLLVLLLVLLTTVLL